MREKKEGGLHNQQQQETFQIGFMTAARLMLYAKIIRVSMKCTKNLERMTK